jgi:iron complex outermembrane recepter protein
MKSILLSLFTLVSFYASANITGKVQSETLQPFKNATIELLSSKDSQLVKTEISNAEGAFEFTNIKNGSYFVKASYTGYQKYYSSNILITDNAYALPSITLVKITNEIKGVNVVAKKPFIEVKADKTVINVENSINSTGSNALEILQKSPGVMVDKDDNISLKGKPSVLIYIDGKQTYMDQQSIANLLRNTQSSAIESIELITNPSAKYDAEGNAGIINIKLKKSRRSGTNGTVNTGVNFGKTPKANASVSINHNHKKINTFGMYNVGGGNNENYNNFLRLQNGINYDQKSVQGNNDFSQGYKAGIDYNYNTKNTFGIMANGNVEDATGTSNSTTFINNFNQPVSSRLLAANNVKATFKNINLNANYKFADTNGTSLNIDLDYGTMNKTSFSNQPNTYTDANGNATNFILFRNNTPTNIDIKTAKIDYERKFYKGVLGFGAKTAFINTNNKNEFFDVQNGVESLNSNRSNLFDYLENVNALYANYNRSLNKAWSVQGGVRMENTHSIGRLKSKNPNPLDTVDRNYTDFFPSAGVSWTINPKHSLGLTYSRRIDRPDYQALNPFENKIDELTYQKGNAFLKPQYSNGIELTHTLMQFLVTSLGFSRVTDMYAQVVEQAGNNAAFLTQRNLASSNSVNLNIAAPMPIKKWWFAYLNLGGSFTSIDANLVADRVNIRFPSFNSYMENNFTLPKGYSASVSGWFAAPGYWGGTFKSNPMGNMDIGVSKNFLKRQLNAKVTFTDVLHTNHWRGTTVLNGLNISANGGYESQQLRLALTYRFGNASIKIRDRKTGLETEAGRAGKK